MGFMGGCFFVSRQDSSVSSWLVWNLPSSCLSTGITGIRKSAQLGNKVFMDIMVEIIRSAGKP